MLLAEILCLWVFATAPSMAALQTSPAHPHSSLLLSRLDRLESLLADHQAQFQRERHQWEKEKESLREELHLLQGDVQALQREKQEMRREMEALKNTQTLTQTLAAENQDLKAQLGDLQRQLLSLDSRQQSLQDRLARCEGKAPRPDTAAGEEHLAEEDQHAAGEQSGQAAHTSEHQGESPQGKGSSPQHLRDPDPARHLSDPDPARQLSDPDPAWHMSDSDPARHLSDPDPARHLSDPDRFRQQGRGTARSDDGGPLEAVVNHLAQEVTQLSARVQALSASDAQQRQDIQAAGGSTFVRWGSSTCAGPSSQLVYAGVVGGSWFDHTGAAANALCLTASPQLLERSLPRWYAQLYGGEYQTYDSRLDMDAVCAMCRSPQPTTVMLPGTNVCTAGWTLQYSGFLMAGYYAHPAASQFICVDAELESAAGGKENRDGHLLYYTVTRCGSLPCPPYEEGKIVSCAVCSK